MAPSPVTSKKALVLGLVLAGLAAGLLAFSQSLAAHVDEGFHLLAAQLINAGKRPYLDFFYQHPPLYAYGSALWMKVFGETWRSAHVLSALLTAGSLWLAGAFVLNRIPEPKWQTPAAIACILLPGLDLLFIRFGSIAQPYALSLFLSVAAFRLAVESPGRAAGALPAGAGLCAGAAAASSLLTAPVAPVLLAWMVRHNRAGSRPRKCALFLAGMSVAFLPLLWLAIQGPRQTFFDVVEYHLFYRMPGDQQPPMLEHNLREISTWLTSPQTLLLGFLVGAGLLFLSARHDWNAERIAQFRLCAWLAGTLAIYLAIPRPTYRQYFILTIPFLSILGSVGIYALGTRIWPQGRPARLILAIAAVLALELARSAEFRPGSRPYWPQVENLSRRMERVTPRNAPLYAREEIYFVTRRLPPAGSENPYAPALDLPPGLAAFLRITPQSQLDEWLASGKFATAWLDSDDPRIESLGLDRLYAKKEKVESMRFHPHGGYLFFEPMPVAPRP